MDKQIIGKLKVQESGLKTGGICRKHEMSEATFYKYKAKLDGMEVDHKLACPLNGEWTGLGFLSRRRFL